MVESNTDREELNKKLNSFRNFLNEQANSQLKQYGDALLLQLDIILNNKEEPVPDEVIDLIKCVGEDETKPPDHLLLSTKVNLIKSDNYKNLHKAGAGFANCLNKMSEYSPVQSAPDSESPELIALEKIFDSIKKDISETPNPIDTLKTMSLKDIKEKITISNVAKVALIGLIAVPAAIALASAGGGDAASILQLTSGILQCGDMFKNSAKQTNLTTAQEDANEPSDYRVQPR